VLEYAAQRGTSCVQRGAAWTFAAWCLQFSHGVRGSAGMPAECECEGARGGVSVASSLPCLPRAESPRSPGAVLLRARRSERTPRPCLRHARALLQQGTLPPLLLTFSTVSSSGPGDACILQRKVSLTIKAHGSTMSTGGRR
jgi:hypothetical protein